MNSRRCLIWLNKKRGSAESAGKLMNIQIFGTNKCFDTKKAMRYFKERGARYQFIDMKEKGVSKGEYMSIKQAVGGIDKLPDQNSRDKDTLALIKYIADEDRDEKFFIPSSWLSEKQDLIMNGHRMR